MINVNVRSGTNILHIRLAKAAQLMCYVNKKKQKVEIEAAKKTDLFGRAVMNTLHAMLEIRSCIG